MLVVREEIVKQYIIISCFDQGIGLILEEFCLVGFEENIFVIFSLDNGIFFFGVKMNLYYFGMVEFYLVLFFFVFECWGQISDVMVSFFDIVFMVLDWFGIEYFSYKIFGFNEVQLIGNFVFLVLKKELIFGWDIVFVSYNMYEVIMYYLM